MSHTDWPLHYDSEFRNYEAYRNQMDMWLVDYFCYRYHGIDCYRGEETEFLSGCSDKCVHMCLERLEKVEQLSQECRPFGTRRQDGKTGFEAEILPGNLGDIRRAFGELVPSKWTPEYLAIQTPEEIRDEMIFFLDQLIMVQGPSGGSSLDRLTDRTLQQSLKDILDCSQQRIFVCRLKCQECIDDHELKVSRSEVEISQQKQNKMCESSCASDWYEEYDALVEDGLGYFNFQYPRREKKSGA